MEDVEPNAQRHVKTQDWSASSPNQENWIRSCKMMKYVGLKDVKL